MPAVLILRGVLRSVSPSKVGDFEWSDKHAAYIWQGRELSLEEFNRCVCEVIERNLERWPKVVQPKVWEEGVPTRKRTPMVDAKTRMARARSARRQNRIAVPT